MLIWQNPIVWVFLNGRFVPEEKAVVSVFDRAFLYGDGLFETLRITGGRLYRWTEHLARLRQGSAFLGIRLPISDSRLNKTANRLIKKNQIVDGLLRISVSRGRGPRGYSPAGARRPVLVMTTHSLGKLKPDQLTRWRVIVASFRVATGDVLATFKTCNKLANVLARAEAEAAGADEALLLNTDGDVAEAASSNLFWIEGESVCTTPIVAGILPGITRGVIRELCRALKLPLKEKNISAQRLSRADGVFLTMSSLGIVEVEAIGERRLSKSQIVKRLFDAYQLALRAAKPG